MLASIEDLEAKFLISVEALQSVLLIWLIECVFMFPFSHFFAAFPLLLAVVLSTGLELTGGLMVFSGLLSILPDFDLLWEADFEEHHKSLLHFPVVWIAISLVAAYLWPALGLLIFLITEFHIFTDYLTGRTVGVYFLYPLNRKEYSLYPLDRSTADLNTFRPDKEGFKEHLSHYVENRVQLLIELSVNVVGAASLLILILML